MTYYSFQVQEDLNELNIFRLFFIPFIATLCMIFLDVTSDAWCLDLVDNEYLGFGRAMKLVGQNIGSILSYNIFIELHHAKYLSLQHLLLGIGIYFAVLCVLIFCFKSEDR